MKISSLFSQTVLHFKKSFLVFTLYTLLVFTSTMFIGMMNSISVLLFQFVLLPLLFAGYFVYLIQLNTTGKAGFADFFKAGNHFMPIIVIGSLKSFLFSMLLSPYMKKYGEMLVAVSKEQNAEMYEPLMQSWSDPTFLLAVVGILLCNFLLCLAVPSVLIYGLRAFDGVRWSVVQTVKNITVILPFFIILVLISYSGIFFFGIGLFLTFGFYHCGIYALINAPIYKQNNESEDLDIDTTP